MTWRKIRWVLFLETAHTICVFLVIKSTTRITGFSTFLK